MVGKPGGEARDMSKKNGGGAQKLDLGIQAILARSEPSQNFPHAQPDSQEHPTTILTLDEDGVEFSQEFTTLAQAKQWGILVSKAESAISAGDDIEARLWWIRAHLGGLSLPVSLLAAPFQTVCRQMAADPKLTELYKLLVIEIGEIMRERLRGVGDKRQEHAVIAALQQLGLCDPDETKRQGWSKVPSVAPRFELGEPKPPQASAVSAPMAVKPGRKVSPLLIVMLLVAVSGLLVGVLLQRYWRAESVLVASESMLPVETVAALRPPLVEPRAALSNLGALYYSLSDSGSAAPVINDRPAKPDSSGAPPQEASTRLPETRVAAVEKPASGSKDVVNTGGPVEGPEFRRGVERNGSQEARLPDPMYEPQAKPLPSAGFPEVGGVVLGEVKSVLVQTSVLDSPSYRARIIAKLREGDKVSVEARVGRWVRIRSRKGRTGYVFAQDIGEPEDFRSPGNP
jgi:hypothetical protein